MDLSDALAPSTRDLLVELLTSSLPRTTLQGIANCCKVVFDSFSSENSRPPNKLLRAAMQFLAHDRAVKEHITLTRCLTRCKRVCDPDDSLMDSRHNRRAVGVHPLDIAVFDLSLTLREQMGSYWKPGHLHKRRKHILPSDQLWPSSLSNIFPSVEACSVTLRNLLLWTEIAAACRGTGILSFVSQLSDFSQEFAMEVVLSPQIMPCFKEPLTTIAMRVQSILDEMSPGSNQELHKKWWTCIGNVTFAGMTPNPSVRLNANIPASFDEVLKTTQSPGLYQKMQGLRARNRCGSRAWNTGVAPHKGLYWESGGLEIRGMTIAIFLCRKPRIAPSGSYWVGISGESLGKVFS
ncbi:hypothetical protein B0H10DRAFT_1943708 [Mycena sp. CBHHK59/15]|nr:hypothetical protein B0H10DRAFT_1943708 [Mycena sp. CBHHK59/15]